MELGKAYVGLAAARRSLFPYGYRKMTNTNMEPRETTRTQAPGRRGLLFVQAHMISSPGGEQTTHTTVDEDMVHDTRTQQEQVI